MSVVEVEAVDEDPIHEYGVTQRQSATDADHRGLPVPNSSSADNETDAKGYFVDASAMPTESRIKCLARSRTVAGIAS